MSAGEVLRQYHDKVARLEASEAALLAENERLRAELCARRTVADKVLHALGCRHRFDPECARCRTLEPVKKVLESVGLLPPATPSDSDEYRTGAS